MEDETPSPLPLHQEVAALQQRVAQLEAATYYAEQIVETVRDPLLVLTPDLRVQSANPAFYQLFHVSPVETEGQSIYALGNGISPHYARYWKSCCPTIRSLMTMR